MEIGGTANTKINVKVSSKGAERGARRVKKSLDSMKRSAKKSTSAVKLLQRALTLAAFAKVAIDIRKLDDSWISLNNKLRIAVGDTIDIRVAMQKLQQIAFNTGATLDQTVITFARLSIATKDSTYTMEDMLRVTDTLNKQVLIGGNNAQEAAAGLIQFAQGIASGKLHGDELRSVMENLLGVQIGLVDGFRMLKEAGEIDFDVTKKNIRAYARAGILTSDLLVKSLLKVSKSTDEQFAKIEFTYEQTFNRLTNRITEFVGENDKINDVMGTIKASMNHVVENYNEYGDALEATILLLYQAAKIAAVFYAAQKIQRMARAADAFLLFSNRVGLGGAKLGLFTTILLKARRAMNLLTAAMLRNPITAILVGITAIASVFYTFSDASDRAAKALEREAAEAAKLKNVLEEVKKTKLDTIKQVNAEMLASVIAAQAAEKLKLEKEHPTYNAYVAFAKAQNDRILAQQRPGRGIKIKPHEILSEAEYKQGILDWLVKVNDKVSELEVNEAKIRDRENLSPIEYNEYTKYTGDLKEDIRLLGLKNDILREIDKETKKFDTAFRDAEVSPRQRQAVVEDITTIAYTDAKNSLVAKYATNQEKVNAELAKFNALLEHTDFSEEQHARALAGLKEKQTDFAKNLQQQISLLSLKGKELAVQTGLNRFDSATKDEVVSDEARGKATADLEKLFYATKVRDLTESLTTTQQKLNAEVAEYMDLNERGVISAELFQTAMSANHKRQLAESKDMFAGIERATTTYYDDAMDQASQYESLTTKAFKGMEDALVRFAVTGKLSFSDLANSIIADLARIYIKKQLTGFAAQIIGNFQTANEYGTTPFSEVTNTLAAQDAPFRAEGGPVSRGGTYIVGEKGPEIFTPGVSGTIIPNNAIGGKASIQSASSVKINVHNYAKESQATATATPDGAGGFNIDIMVEQITGKISQSTAKGDGLAPMLERKYGLNAAAGLG